LSDPTQNQYLSRTIISSLHSKNQYSITILTYPSQTPFLPPTTKPTDITHKTTSFTSTHLEDVFCGQDVVISTIAPNDYELQENIINGCVAAGVPRFIPNEFGLDSQNCVIREKLPAYDAKARVSDYLCSLQKDGGSEQGKFIEWVALGVGTVLDQDLLSGKLGVDLKWQSASFPGDSPNDLFLATSLRRVGELVSSVLERWDVVKNSYVYAAGCITSAQQVIDLLEREMQVKFLVGQADQGDLEKEAERMVKGGWPDAGWGLLERSMLFDRDAGKAFIGRKGCMTLGLDREKIGDIIAIAVHEWKHTERGDCGCS
jgi:hypothetical protein